MKSNDTNPAADNSVQDSDERLGDGGKGGRTGSPDRSEQGIANRPDDEEDREAAPDEDDEFEEDEDEDDEEVQDEEDENV
jgi:hypothetical protein